MQKTAQQRGILNKVREKVSPVGGLEEVFDPEFKELMNKLRKLDDQIRAELTGKQIGDEVPTGSDGKPVADVDDVPNFKKYISDAEKHLERREYMKAFADIAKFHSVIEKVSNLISGFKTNVDAVHERFLFSDLVPERYEEGSEEYAKYLDELKKKFKEKREKKEKKAGRQYEMIAQAGLLDFFHNLGTQRGRALYFWEKRYPKKVKALKVATKSIISAAKSLETNIMKVLKTMATARATRNVDSYVTQAFGLMTAFESFDSKFDDYYDDHIKEFLEKQELFAPTKETKDPGELGSEEVDEKKKEDFTFELDLPKEFNKPEDPEEFSSRQLGLPFGDEGVSSKSLEIEDIPPETQRTPMAPETPPATVGPTGTVPMSPDEYELRRRQPVSTLTRMPPAPKNPSIPFGERTQPMPSADEEQIRALMRETQPGKISFEPTVIEHRRGIGVGRTSSEQFISSLESLSFESPLILAKYITKYAETIKNKEPETYRKLMNIVSSIEV